MEKLVHLTTPLAQLRGSIALIGLLLVLIAITAAIFDAPLRSAELAARQAAERAWISAVLDQTEIEYEPERLRELWRGQNSDPDNKVSIYRNGDDVNALSAVRFIANDGYNGDIELALGVEAGGKIIGIAVLRHTETPGFGAIISEPANPWMNTFVGRSLNAPARLNWRLSASGGAIDGISGATITSNAIIDGIRQTLDFVERHAN